MGSGASHLWPDQAGRWTLGHDGHGEQLDTLDRVIGLICPFPSPGDPNWKRWWNAASVHPGQPCCVRGGAGALILLSNLDSKTALKTFSSFYCAAYQPSVATLSCIFLLLSRHCSAMSLHMAVPTQKQRSPSWETYPPIWPMLFPTQILLEYLDQPLQSGLSTRESPSPSTYSMTPSLSTQGCMSRYGYCMIFIGLHGIAGYSVVLLGKYWQYQWQI